MSPLYLKEFKDRCQSCRAPAGGRALCELHRGHPGAHQYPKPGPRRFWA